MSALIDGDLFVAEFTTVFRGGGQLFVNAAGSQQQAIGFQFPDQGPGTYTIGVGLAVSAGVTIGSAAWIAGGDTGSGTITVTVLTEHRIEGSFSLVVENGPGPSTLDIMDGRFEIDY